MPGPDISPLLARIGGPEYRDRLRDRLLQLAAETDDMAYASRLREAADGTRPLRTLTLDPAWHRQFASAIEASSAPLELDDERRIALEHRIDELRRRGTPLPTNPDDAASLARDALRRAARARQIAREDELAGWDHVPDSPRPDAGQE